MIDAKRFLSVCMELTSVSLADIFQCLLPITGAIQAEKVKYDDQCKHLIFYSLQLSVI